MCFAYSGACNNTTKTIVILRRIVFYIEKQTRASGGTSRSLFGYRMFWCIHRLRNSYSNGCP